MKICIVTRSVIKGDGQGRANYEVVWEAIRRGYEITLIATNVAPDLQRNSKVTWIHIPVKGYPTQLLSSLVFSQRSEAWLKKHRHDFDIIQVYGAVTDVEADINTIQFVHTAWFKSPMHISHTRRDSYGIYQWLYTALNASWERKALRQAKVVVAVSEKIKQDLIDVGVPPDKIQIILNGVDLEEFTPGSTERSSLGLPEGVPLALFVGDIRTNRKNLDTVLRALGEVPNLQLAVVGAVEGSPYPDLAAKLAVDQRVHFLDFRRDVAAIMKAVDLFVFPSRYEACTLVLLEAMASGLPVITAATAGGAEIVTPECGVVLSDSEDVHTLIRSLNELVNDSARRTQMGQAARAIAEQHSWVSKARDYVDLFEALAGS